MRFAPLFAAALLPLLASPAGAQSAAAAHDGHARPAAIFTPDAIPWGPGPATLPPGARAAVLEGDPKQAGPFIMRLSLPDGYRIPPHYHPAEERVTVISGAFQVGMGDTYDESKLTTLPAGALGLIPPGMRHFARAKGETVLQVHGVGPWRLVYVNPADQPKPATP